MNMREQYGTKGPLSTRIFLARVEAGLSRQQLAAVCGVSRRAIEHWEQGTRTPRSQYLLPLSRATGTPIRVLLGEEAA